MTSTNQINMNITKQIAAEIAAQIVSDSEAAKRLEQRKEELQKKVAEMVKAEIPEELIAAYKKWPMYIHSTRNVVLKTENWWQNMVELSEPVPSIYSGYHKLEADHGEIVTQQNKVGSEQKRLDGVRKDLADLIYSQKTSKKLLATMPEAEKYLPEQPENTGGLLPVKITPQSLLQKLV